MTDSPDAVAADLQILLQRVMDATRQLEAVLHQLTLNLQQRKLELAVDLDGLVRNLRRSVERAQQHSESVSRRLEQLQNLIRTSALITSALELDQVLEEVVESVRALTGAERVYLMLREPDSDELIIRASHNWDQETCTERDVQFSRSVVRQAIDRGEPIVTTNAQVDERFQGADSVVTQGLRSILCIPLVLQRRIVGVLYADNRVRAGLFSPGNIPFLAAFGTQAAIAIEKARLYEQEIRQHRLKEELAVAQRIQHSLLPKSVPVVPGWDFAAVYRPARVVSGDFYDFIELPDGRLGVVIADVADKGVPAALFMATSRTTIRTTALSCPGPAVALMQANTLILEHSPSDLFLSAFYAVVDPAGGKMTFTNAGHNRPLWLRAERGALEELTVRGIVLGVLKQIELRDREIDVAPGDAVIFYTDGVTEAMNAKDEEFGEERLRAAILANRWVGAGAILQAVVEAVLAFIGEAPQSDDFTMVVLRRGALD